MKKLLQISILALLTAMWVMIGLSYATTFNPSTCSKTIIQSIITNNAVPGDTINVPAGNCTWDSTLLVTKAINIIGAGNNGDTVCDVGETCITANWTTNENKDSISSYLIYINVVSTGYPENYNKDMRISGFNFNLNNKTMGLFVIHNSMTYPLNKFQLDHNVFYNAKCPSSYSAEGRNPYYYFFAEAYGVIHNNYFLGYPTGTFASKNEAWGVHGKYPGSSKALYFEDNIVSMTTNCLGAQESRAPEFSMGTGASAVFRYNTVTRDITGGPSSIFSDWFQNHGNNDWNNTGGMVLESYGNKFTDVQSVNFMFANIRGGRNMVFFNQMITTKAATAFTGPYMDIIECEECQSTYPNNGRGADINSPTGYNCPTGDNRLYPTGANGVSGTCSGDNWWTALRPEWWPNSSGISASDSNCWSCSADGQPQHVWKSYFWNNRAGAGGANNGIIRMWHMHGLSPEREIVENTHYFGQRQGATFDGSLTPVTDIHGGTLGKPGMGCGLIGDRPLTCSSGAGYWVIPNATDYSCSQVLSTNIGKNPSKPISGYLSTCKTTNIWSANIQSDIDAGYTYVPYTYPHPLRTNPVSDTDPPIPYGVASPTGPQACDVDPTDVPVSFQVTDINTVTCRSCKEGTESCTSATTYDQMVAMTGETVYTSSRVGNTHTQTASISSACSSNQKHWARCTDSYGNDMTTSIGITYTMDANEDSDDPELVSATLGADGVSLSLVFDEDVQFGTGNADTDWTLTRNRGGLVTGVPITYNRGAGSPTLVYTTDSAILTTDTITITYTQPGNGIVDKGSAPATYADSCPDAAKYGDLIAEVPNGDTGGMCTWGIKRNQRYPDGAPLTGNVVSFTDTCDETDSLGCIDIDETYCIRVTKAQYVKDEDVYAYKKISDTDITGDIYLQFYFKNMGQPTDSTGCTCVDGDPPCTIYTCTGETNMTEGHDVEIIGFTPGQKTTYAALPGDYPANIYFGLQQRSGILTLSAFHYITHNHEIRGTTTVGNDSSKWIGVRLHIYNSATTGDYYEWWADWANDGTWTKIGDSRVSYYDHSTSSYSSAAITFAHPFRYIYIGQNDLEGKVDFQITGIKLNTTGFPSGCNRTVGANNELASIGATGVTNNSDVGSETTITIFDQSSGAPGYVVMTYDNLNLGTRFQSSQTGIIKKICFYKDVSITGTHIGTIWSSNGEPLSQVTFSETASGWQCQALSADLNILKNTTYTAAVFAPTNYTRTANFFGNSYSNNGYLTAQAENSYWSYSTSTNLVYPDQRSVSYSNYWVDVEVEYAGATGPWEITVTNASATGTKCTITEPASSHMSIANGETGEIVVITAPGWKSSVSGCGGAEVKVSNTNTFTTAAMSADCEVTVVCSEKQIAPWITP